MGEYKITREARKGRNCGPNRVPRGLLCRGDTEDMADVLDGGPRR